MPDKRKIISSLFWKFFERAGTQLIQFGVTIALARILVPEDFGLVALIAIFINVAAVFVQSGLNTALIQKKDADELDFSSVFWASLGIALATYTVLFFAAPFIADFYDQSTLTIIVRVLALTLFIDVFSSIQNAYVSRNMLFKKLFFRSVGAIIPSGILGITLALYGFGIWALVCHQFCNAFLAVAIMWFTIPWRPSFKFSYTRFKSLFSYGWKLLLSSLIDVIYTNLRGLIIGKFFSPADLAYYNRGDTFPFLIVNNINTAIGSVLLPSFAAVQNDTGTLKRMMRRSIITSTFIITPMMIGLAVMAKQVVLLVLGEKWLPCVPFVQICCCIYLFYPIHTANLSAIKAIGRSDIFLILEIIKKICGLTILVASYFYFKSPIGIAYGALVSTLLCSFINASPNKKLLDYGYIEQILDVSPALLLAIPMGAVVYAINLIECPLLLQIFLQVFTGAITYFGLARLFKMERLDYLVKTVQEYRKRKKNG
jgi:O-antigen/teichoic acid export membrane protein